MNQISQFYQSHLVVAAANHARMAEMQRAAGLPGLAHASAKTAMARRVAASNLERFKGNVRTALDYGEWGAQQVFQSPMGDGTG